jgi:predicted outer membrane repeat protein
LTNVTFSNNTAGIHGGALSNGGIFDVESDGTIDVIHATFSENAAADGGDAVYNESGAVTIRNSCRESVENGCGF